MSNQVNNVSIDLRNLDGINLLGESDKENGGQRSTSAKEPAVKEIIKARAKGMHRWNTFFIIVCAFAVFIDPLFCYINVIEEDYMCFNYDVKLLWAYVGLRMVVDVFYVVDIIIYLCGTFKKRKGKKLWACWKSRNDQNTVVPRKQVIKRWYSVLLPILPGILVALPIPEVLLLSTLRIYWDPIYVIFIFTSIQYMLRIFLIYGSQRGRLMKKTATGRWLKPLLDFLPFVLASHRKKMSKTPHYLATQSHQTNPPRLTHWCTYHNFNPFADPIYSRSSDEDFFSVAPPPIIPPATASSSRVQIRL